MDFQSEKIWHNGAFLDWDQATVHVASHALHYGSAWFEGIRCYQTSRGSEVFRLREHVDRLFNSCKIYRTQIPFSPQEILDAILETVRANRLKHCYIRPLVMRGYGSMGVNPLPAPVEVYLMAWEWGRYLGDEAMELGVDVCVSSWSRAAPNTFPAMAKVAGNYLNSALIKMEALSKGYAEGIALDTQGCVSEGSGENLFLVKNDQIFTPSLDSALLPGITRESVIQLASERGYSVTQQRIPREMLYCIDELFLSGTATEIVPIRSVDGIVIGTGKRGPVTTQIQRDFLDYVEGKTLDRHGWMTAVYREERVQSS